MRFDIYLKTVTTLCLILLLTTLCVAGNNSVKNHFDPFGTGAEYPDLADGRKTPVPAITAYPLGEMSVKLDGIIDDPVWQLAETAKGLRIWSPNRGDIPCRETAFKIAYDDEAIYVAFAAYENDFSMLGDQLTRRDNITDSDFMGIYIDPYHDHTTAYNFMVSPSGVQGDRYVYNDGSMDNGWDAVWEAEVSRDENGWYGEYRIPYSAVRFKHSDKMTWGLNFYRFMHRHGEDTGWTVWDKETRGFVSRFGELRGLDGIPKKQTVKLLPYVVHRSTDPSDGDFHNFDNFGLDLAMNVTSNLTLNATFQPDFGQVEADPALLNISPFETHYQEKRPFFVEGQQYFWHPDFIQFNPRRIGTGDINSRIRAAGKLLGKTANGISIAALYAATDITGEGQAHNFLKSGDLLSHFAFAKFGREFKNGTHKVNLAQSMVIKPDDRDQFGNFATRDGYTTGADFDMNFKNREYNFHGSFIGSIVDPAELENDPTVDHEPIFGTGGNFELRRLGGLVKGGLWGKWETEKLDINDFGYIESPDELTSGFWSEYDWNPKPGNSLFRSGGFELSYRNTLFYSGNEGPIGPDGEPIWQYETGHKQSSELNLEGSLMWNSFWDMWGGIGGEGTGTSKYETRSFEGIRGPLIETQAAVWAWFGFQSDYRKPLKLSINFSRWFDEADGQGYELKLTGRLNATSAQSYTFNFSYDHDFSSEQHLDNFANPNYGIGGVSYLFAKLHRQTLNLTMRGNILFTRDLSLQLYLQPYMTTGDYHQPGELSNPNSFDFNSPESVPGFEFGDENNYDFRYTAVNTNVVLRYEYNSGSTFFFVWKQAYESYYRGNNDINLDLSDLFASKPENVFLAKMTYWFEI